MAGLGYWAGMRRYPCCGRSLRLTEAEMEHAEIRRRCGNCGKWWTVVRTGKPRRPDDPIGALCGWDKVQWTAETPEGYQRRKAEEYLRRKRAAANASIEEVRTELASVQAENARLHAELKRAGSGVSEIELEEAAVQQWSGVLTKMQTEIETLREALASARAVTCPQCQAAVYAHEDGA